MKPMHSFNILLGLIGLLMMTPIALGSEPICKYPRSEISKAKWEACRQLVLARNGNTVRHEKDRTIVFTSKPWLTYVFTTAVHRAHPAVVWKIDHVEGELAAVEKDGYFAGDELEFVDFLLSFGFMAHKMPERDESPTK